MASRHDWEPRQRRGAIPAPKRDAVETAVAALLGEHGASGAVKRVQSNLRLARRARSRKHYAFWAAVGAELELYRSEHRGTGPIGAVVT